MANQNKRDRKAQKSRARSREKAQEEKKTRRPSQKGKIKKRLNTRSYHAFHMRSAPPTEKKIDIEAERIMNQTGISHNAANSVAYWRHKKGII